MTSLKKNKLTKLAAITLGCVAQCGFLTANETFKNLQPINFVVSNNKIIELPDGIKPDFLLVDTNYWLKFGTETPKKGEVKNFEINGINHEVAFMEKYFFTTSQLVTSEPSIRLRTQASDNLFNKPLYFYCVDKNGSAQFWSFTLTNNQENVLYLKCNDQTFDGFAVKIDGLGELPEIQHRAVYIQENNGRYINVGAIAIGKNGLLNLGLNSAFFIAINTEINAVADQLILQSALVDFQDLKGQLIASTKRTKNPSINLNINNVPNIEIVMTQPGQTIHILGQLKENIEQDKAKLDEYLAKDPNQYKTSDLTALQEGLHFITNYENNIVKGENIANTALTSIEQAKTTADPEKIKLFDQEINEINEVLKTLPELKQKLTTLKEKLNSILICLNGEKEISESITTFKNDVEANRTNLNDILAKNANLYASDDLSIVQNGLNVVANFESKITEDENKAQELIKKIEGFKVGANLTTIEALDTEILEINGLLNTLSEFKQTLSPFKEQLNTAVKRINDKKAQAEEDAQIAAETEKKRIEDEKKIDDADAKLTGVDAKNEKS